MEMNIDFDLLFSKSELIPVITQQKETGRVLMLAYMNRESLKKTIETGQTWYFSRSRNCLWHKGETSGHVQTVHQIFADCDCDTLLIVVSQQGVACHTGKMSCFYNLLYDVGEDG